MDNPCLEQIEGILESRNRSEFILTFQDGTTFWVSGLGIGRDLGVPVPFCTADQAYRVPIEDEHPSSARQVLFFHLDEVVRISDPVSGHVLLEVPAADSEGNATLHTMSHVAGCRQP